MMRTRTTAVVLVVALVAVGALAVGVFAGGSPSPDSAASREPSPTTTPTAPTATLDGFVEFRDEEAGIALSYPESWQRLEAPDPDIRLVATPNNQDSLLVRSTDLGFEVGPAEFPAAQSLTDEIVQSAPEVEVLAGPQRIELGGLPGYFYLYTFADEPSGQRGVHAHYFLFDGSQMITLVLQALPEDQYGALAGLFDQIASTFTDLDGQQDPDRQDSDQDGQGAETPAG